MQKEKQLIPQLRFSEFDREWSNYKLGDVCQKIQDGNYGGSYPKSNEFVDVGIPFLTSKALGGNGVLKENKVDFISLEKHKELKKAHLKLNDVLFTNRGSNVGSIGFVDKRISNGNIGPQLTLLRSNRDRIEPLFLYQIMTSFSIIKQVRSQDSGSAMNFFGITATSKFKIVVPQKEEQQKIANFLTSIDNQIQTLEKKKSLLEHYKKGVLQKIFKQELRFKDEDGNAFPEWEKLQLIDVAERIKAKNKVDNQNVLTISAQLGLVSQLEYFNKSVSAKNLTGYYLLEKNDFAYNKSYSKGYPMGAIKRLDKYALGVVSTLYICFRFNKKVSLDFMEQYFNAGLQNKEIEKVAQEGARNHGLLNIGVNDFFEIDLKIPSLKEQTKIADFLSAIDKNIELVNTKIEHTKDYKKGLLQQMFV